MLKKIAISVLFIAFIIPTAVRAGETISEREAVRIAERFWQDWESERWESLYNAGIYKSRSTMTEKHFAMLLTNSVYRLKSFRVVKINIIYNGRFDAYAETVFKCKSPFSCPEQKKLVELSVYNEEGQWKLWLGDIIYGEP